MAAAGRFDVLMAEALDVARRGRGHVEPNPRVGALALQGDVVVGRGWHPYYGGAHAEVGALADAAARGARPDTVVVTLEPCSSELGEGGKKTPPCTRALLDAGIPRVVVGADDPDPRHAGRGLQVLRDAGVEVIEGVLAERFAAENRPFLRALQLDRPWTIAKWAMTLDGKAAAVGGDSRWISGEAARLRVHELRGRVDAVVVGFRTAQRDDPELTVRDVAGASPLRIVVDPRAELAVDSKLATTARDVPVLLLVRDDADAARCAALTGLGVELLACEPVAERGLDLAAAWRALHARGLRRVLVEGGGELLAQLVERGCVDQTLCFVAPKLIGGRDAPTPLGGAGRPAMADAWRLGELYQETCGEDVVIGGFF